MRNNRLLMWVILFAFVVSCGKEEIITELNVQDFTSEIQENPRNGDEIGKVKAEVNIGELRYSIQTQIPDGAVALDAQTGMISVLDAAHFDYEKNEEITGSILITGGEVTKTAMMVISIKNVFDSPSEIIAQDFVAEVDENPVNGQEIGAIVATAGQQELSYEIKSQEPEGAIEIDGQTGVITVSDSAAFDFESRERITAEVSVFSGEFSTPVQVEIKLNNIVDSPSEIVGEDFIVEINENPIKDQQLGKIESDGTMAEVLFEISSQDPEGAIAINEESGVLTVATPSAFDFEQRRKVNAEVIISAGSTTKKVNVEVSIKNLFDDESEMTVEGFAVTVDENIAVGSELGTVEVKSDSTGFVFAIASESEKGALEIDPNTGKISVKDPGSFDYEKLERMTAKVVVSKNEVMLTADVEINLTNVFDDPSEITLGAFFAEVDENVDAGTELGTISASAAESPIQYSLVSESVAGALVINQNTGVVTVNNRDAFNFENNQSIDFTYIVAVAGVEKSAQGTVSLNNLVDTRDEIFIEDQTTTIWENPDAGLALMDLSDVRNNVELTYEIVSETRDGAFSIDPTTGVLTVNDPSKFDYEMGASFQASISASFNGISNSAIITIHLKDIAEVTEGKHELGQVLAYFPFDDNNPEDILGTIRDAVTVRGELTPGTDRKGNAAGCNDFYNGTISIPGSKMSGLSEFSVSAWVTVALNNENQCIFVKVGSGRDIVFRLNKPAFGGALMFEYVNQGNAIYGSEKMIYDEWIHVAITYKNGYATLYMDGRKIGEKSSSPIAWDDTRAIRIGGISTNGERIDGAIDDLTIFTTELTAAEILSLKNDE